MGNLKIWKNTSVLNNYSEGLFFTENKNKADIILLGSRKVKIEEFKSLKGIYRAGVGIENVPTTYCRKKNILIKFPSKKTKNFLYEETANYTISLIFRMLYPIPSINIPWSKNTRLSLENKKVLIIGMGNIGSRVKQKLETMVSVLTYDILNNKFNELGELIKKADVITLHMPNLIENINFFDETKLNLMKQDSILVNTARANLVDEDSLYKQISEGKIKAAFDVFWDEPYKGKLKDYYPDSFYMSPHIASSSEDFFLGCRNDLDKMIKKINQ